MKKGKRKRGNPNWMKGFVFGKRDRGEMDTQDIMFEEDRYNLRGRRKTNGRESF